MAKFENYNLKGFRGINKQDDPATLQDQFLEDCDNFIIEDGGALRKRTGIVGASNTITGSTVFDLHLLISSQEKIFAANQDRFVSFLYDGTVDKNVSGRPHYKSAVEYVDKLYLKFDGTNGIDSYDLSTEAFTNVTGAPAGKVIYLFKDRVWVLSGNKIYFSTAGDPTDWPSTNFIIVSKNANYDPLTAVYAYQDILIITSQYETWALTVQGSPENWILRKISDSIGANGQDCITEIDGFIYLLSRDGLYRSDTLVFTRLADALDIGLGSVGTLDANNWIVRYKNLLITGNYSGGVIYVYHLNLQTWTKWTPPSGAKANTLKTPILAPSDDWQEGVYFGSGGDFPTSEPAKLLWYGDDTYVDFTTGSTTVAYTAKILTKQFDFNEPVEYKRILWMGVDKRAYHDMTVKLYENDNSTPTLTQTVAGSVNNNRVLAKMKGPEYCRTLQVEVEHAVAAACYIFGLTFVAAQKRRLVRNI